MRRPSFFDVFNSTRDMAARGRAGNAISRIVFLSSSPSKQPYRTMPIQPSAHLSSSIIRLVITTALSMMPLSRTVNMRKNSKNQLA